MTDEQRYKLSFIKLCCGSSDHSNKTWIEITDMLVRNKDKKFYHLHMIWYKEGKNQDN